MNKDKAPISFYRGFLERDWDSFPDAVRLELTDFLGALQSAPTDEQLLARCEVHQKDFLAYGLPDEYWLFFQIQKTNDMILNVLELRPNHFRIVVLDVSVVFSVPELTW